MTQLGTPYRSDLRAGRDGFWQVLRAEWTKFRTVRGWAIALVAVAVLTAVMPILLSTPAKSNDNVTCVRRPGGCFVGGQTIATGPAGDAVTDTFYFVHQPMAVSGSITARVSALRASGNATGVPPGYPEALATQPWAKAGLIIKASTRPGSAYAAVMLTGRHGIRMQYNFTQDIAGNEPVASAATPRWLRLTRAGDLITGYESPDGTRWTRLGTARLAGLSGTVQAGLFVTSPDFIESQGSGDDRVDLPTHATAAFDGILLHGGLADQSWAGTSVGSPPAGVRPTLKCASGGRCKGLSAGGGFTSADGRYVVGGSGDIAPYEPDVDPIDVAFLATLFGLITVIALGAVFVTAEYRRGLIRTSLTASPRRGRVLLAKSIVIAGVTFVAALIGAAIAFHVSEQKLIANGWAPPVWPDISLTSGAGLQIVLGTAAIAAGASVLGLAAGTIFRRSAGAVLAVAGLLVIPFILAHVLPLAWADWLLRLTPAAAFSLQAGVRHYPQVNTVCAPYHGCFPLAGWDGSVVLAAWVLVALAGGFCLLRRRDA
ncbi:MAG TPA: ABC transporter permease subunit [Streptosporangiaceae bacterium]